MNKYKDLFFSNIEKRQIIFKNTFWLYLGQAISRLARFLIVIYAARVLGVSSYGSFSFILSFVGLTFLLSDLGVNSLFIREFHKKELDRKKLFSNSLYLKLILIFLSVVLTIALAPFIDDQQAKGVLILIVALYSINALRNFFVSVVRAEEKMQFETLTLIIEGIATAVLGFLFLSKSPSLHSLSYAYIFGSFLALVLTYLFLFKQFKLKSDWDWQLMKKVISYSWPFALGAVVGVFVGSLDQVLIGWIKNPSEVAFYSVGLRIIQTLIMVPLFLGVAILPNLSRFTKDREKLSALISRSLTFVGMLALPVLVGGIVLGDSLIVALFGGDYSPAILAFQIQLFMIPFIFFTVIFEHFLLAVNLQMEDIKFTTIAATVNIILSLILIPKFGFYGAAVATLFAQIINFILTYRLSARFLNSKIFNGSSFTKISIATLCMFLFILIIEETGLSVFYIITLSIGLYFSALYFLKDQSMMDIIKLFKTNEL